MTIESLLERIATSCERQERLLEQMFAPTESDVRAAAPMPAPTPAPMQMNANPFVPPEQQFVPPAVPAASPLTDAASVMVYCMEKYRTLGPIKGGLIQEVIVALGHTTLAALRPDQYPEFHSRVEAIK